jgi:hypothetical protein
MENIRPTFLTVLCVLTFLGSALGLYSAITNYSAAGVASGVTQEAFDEIKDKIEEEGEDQPGSNFAGKILDSVSQNLTEEKIKNAAMGSGISNILTLIGAILMWGLNRKGFFVYVAGAVAGIITPLFIYDGFVGALAGGGTAFVSIIFVVLYFLNLKHLK